MNKHQAPPISGVFVYRHLGLLLFLVVFFVYGMMSILFLVFNRKESTNGKKTKVTRSIC